MNHDRPENGEQTTPLPDSAGNPIAPRAGPAAVDDHGIPILDEVVYPETDLSDDSALVNPEVRAGHGLHLPDPETVLAAMRVQLRDRMENDLNEIVDRVAATTAERLEKALRRELREMLDRHLRKLLDEIRPDGSLDER
jgi:hypothetical protein